uniref:Uncharacterized protein n=1 Tax=Timema monikensis TaxID=170555 RepID=A0A7R9HP67_9NEOP|nr:unnamed protein product [Timema monikensis]
MGPYIVGWEHRVWRPPPPRRSSNSSVRHLFLLAAVKPLTRGDMNDGSEQDEVLREISSRLLTFLDEIRRYFTRGMVTLHFLEKGVVQCWIGSRNVTKMRLAIINHLLAYSLDKETCEIPRALGEIKVTSARDADSSSIPRPGLCYSAFGESWVAGWQFVPPPPLLGLWAACSQYRGCCQGSTQGGSFWVHCAPVVRRLGREGSFSPSSALRTWSPPPTIEFPRVSVSVSLCSATLDRTDVREILASVCGPGVFSFVYWTAAFAWPYQGASQQLFVNDRSGNVTRFSRDFESLWVDRCFDKTGQETVLFLVAQRRVNIWLVCDPVATINTREGC